MHKYFPNFKKFQIKLFLIWSYIYAFFTKRYIHVFVNFVEEGEEDNILGTVISLSWEVRYGDRVRRANTIKSSPTSADYWVIAACVQLAEELAGFTFHLKKTAAFIYLDDKRTIPIIIDTNKLIPSRTNEES